MYLKVHWCCLVKVVSLRHWLFFLVWEVDHRQEASTLALLRSDSDSLQEVLSSCAHIESKLLMETLQFGLLLSSFLSSHWKERFKTPISSAMWETITCQVRTCGPNTGFLLRVKIPIHTVEWKARRAGTQSTTFCVMDTASFNHGLQSSKHYSESEVVHMLVISPVGKLRQKDGECKLRLDSTMRPCLKNSSVMVKWLKTIYLALSQYPL